MSSSVLIFCFQLHKLSTKTSAFIFRLHEALSSLWMPMLMLLFLEFSSPDCLARCLVGKRTPSSTEQLVLGCQAATCCLALLPQLHAKILLHPHLCKKGVYISVICPPFPVAAWLLNHVRRGHLAPLMSP